MTRRKAALSTAAKDRSPEPIMRRFEVAALDVVNLNIAGTGVRKPNLGGLNRI